MTYVDHDFAIIYENSTALKVLSGSFYWKEGIPIGAPVSSLMPLIFGVPIDFTKHTDEEVKKIILDEIEKVTLSEKVYLRLLQVQVAVIAGNPVTVFCLHYQGPEDAWKSFEEYSNRVSRIDDLSEAPKLKDVIYMQNFNNYGFWERVPVMNVQLGIVAGENTAVMKRVSKEGISEDLLNILGYRV